MTKKKKKKVKNKVLAIVRTPLYHMRVVKSKKKYDRKRQDKEDV